MGRQELTSLLSMVCRHQLAELTKFLNPSKSINRATGWPPSAGWPGLERSGASSRRPGLPTRTRVSWKLKQLDSRPHLRNPCREWSLAACDHSPTTPLEPRPGFREDAPDPATLPDRRWRIPLTLRVTRCHGADELFSTIIRNIGSDRDHRAAITSLIPSVDIALNQLEVSIKSHHNPAKKILSEHFSRSIR
ncbi:MAG: hypothetical protein JWP89_3750 [Schlesneria sp.]|nr:hypothetical protein [Schlesneria sp.]